MREAYFLIREADQAKDVRLRQTSGCDDPRYLRERTLIVLLCGIWDVSVDPDEVPAALLEHHAPGRAETDLLLRCEILTELAVLLVVQDDESGPTDAKKLIDEGRGALNERTGCRSWRETSPSRVAHYGEGVIPG